MQSVLINIVIFLLTLPFVPYYKGIDLIRKPDRSFSPPSVNVEQPAGTWTQAPKLPTTRYEFGGDVINDTIYILGGLPLPTVYWVTGRVDAYSVSDQTWRQVASLPHPVHHPGVVALDGMLYVVGGNQTGTEATSWVYAYDPAKNQWEKKADLPEPRAAMGIGAVGGKIYVIGGSRQHMAYSETFIYDPISDSWSTGASMPEPREHVASAVVGGKLYAIGGLVEHWLKPLSNVYEYDPETNIWREVASLPIPISGMDAVGYNRSIYVIGGQQRYAVSNLSFEFLPSQNRWVRRADMPLFPRYAGVVVAASDGIHLLGGNQKVSGAWLLRSHHVFVPGN